MADVMELLDEVYRETAIGDVVAQHVVVRAMRDGDGIVKRRRQRGWTVVAAAIVVVGAGIALVVGGPRDHRATVTVSQSTVQPALRPGLSQATDAEFPGLELVETGARTVASRMARDPSAVTATIVHTTVAGFDGLLGVHERPQLADKPIYAVELTGTTFTCDHSCLYITRPSSGAGADFTWDPATKSEVEFGIGGPIDISRLGKVYLLFGPAGK